MDITVLANHVALDHLVVEDVSIAIAVLMTSQHLEIALATCHCHVIVQHILASEVHHRSYGVVKYSKHRIAIGRLEAREILVVSRHLLSFERHHRIRQTHVGAVLDQLALQHIACTVLAVRQRTHQHGVVEHSREKQLSFLSVCQLVVAADTKLVVSAFKEFGESIIIGREDSLTTRSTQHIGITQVINQLAIRIKRTLQFLGLLKLFVDTLAKP